jgi:cell division protein FtsQ
MWDNAPALRTTANLLLVLAAALALYGAAHFVIYLPVFPIRIIRVTGDVSHVTHEQVQAVLARELRGNFFTVDLIHACAAFEKLPWVRKVNVRRVWPDRLEFAVEEHKPVARWGSTALVSARGEVFEAAINTALPVLHGPEGTALEVVSRFQAFEQTLQPLGRHIEQITLSTRRAWVLELDNGMVLELGRGDLESRLARFVSAYELTVARLPQPSTYIDLRYSNGFAVRSAGLKWNGKKS